VRWPVAEAMDGDLIFDGFTLIVFNLKTDAKE
jgi:hypothetical protein